MIGPTANVQFVCVFEQTPFQPSKVDPWSGAAVSVTDLPKPYWAVHVGPQSSFDAVTRPLPLPPFVRRNCTSIVVASCGSDSLFHAAPAQVFWSSTVIVHVFALVRSQFGENVLKVLGEVGVAVSLTWVCGGNTASHLASSSDLQSIPAGSLVTRPSSSRESLMPSVSGLKVATIVVMSWSSVTVQEPVPGQSGVLQPEKLLPPDATAAVSLTLLPRS